MRRLDSAIVIADDFTGACDTAAGMAKCARPSCPVVMLDREVSEGPGTSTDVERLLAGHGIVICDTESRHLGPTAAADRVREAAHRAAAIGVRGVYKKIDSTLRGNIAVEIEALTSVFPDRVLVVAPAFPALGRTTEGGRCLVYGVPVSDTTYARDRRSPVVSSDLSEVFRCAARVVCTDPERLNGALAAAQPGTAVVVDAVETQDLESIGRSVADRLEQVILVGSAGLAFALATVWGKSEGLSATLRPPTAPLQGTGSTEAEDGAGVPNSDGAPKGDRSSAVDEQPPATLGVVGSLNPVSRRQLRLASEECGIGLELIHGKRGRERHERIVAALDAGRPVVLASPEPATPITDVSARRMSAALAGVVRRTVGLLIRRRRAHTGGIGLILAGGDTAVAVIHALGADTVLVTGEMSPGVATGTALCRSDGRELEVALVTKAGGFGDDRTLIKAFEYLRRTLCSE